MPGLRTETNSDYSYDYYIPSLNLLIELDGRQHFENVPRMKSLKYNTEHDLTKIKYAKENNYSLIHLLTDDVRKNKNNWELKLFKKIKKYEEPTLIFIDNNKKMYGKLKSLI